MKKYEVIYADPPWGYSDKSKHRGGAERHYKTMSELDIRKLPVHELAADNSTLFMWVTFPFLQVGLSVMEDWGFKYKTIGFNWVKMNKKSPTPFWGMGHWTRSNSELCLIGVRGKPKRVDAGVHSVVMEPIQKHSKKPDIVRDNIVRLMGDVPRIELFARDTYDGWDAWGNEVETTINLETDGND